MAITVEDTIEFYNCAGEKLGETIRTMSEREHLELFNEQRQAGNNKETSWIYFL